MRSPRMPPAGGGNSKRACLLLCLILACLIISRSEASDGPGGAGTCPSDDHAPLQAAAAPSDAAAATCPPQDTQPQPAGQQPAAEATLSQGGAPPSTGGPPVEGARGAEAGQAPEPAPQPGAPPPPLPHRARVVKNCCLCSRAGGPLPGGRREGGAPRAEPPAGEAAEAARAGDEAPRLAEADRHNFADARDGAKLVAANKEAKKAGAVLDSDGDTYLKNDCKADKWVLVELSQVAKVDELQVSQASPPPACRLATQQCAWEQRVTAAVPMQFELYSSRVNGFEVRGRQTHPRHDGVEYSKGLGLPSWWLLGRFNASNTKGTQVGLLEPALGNCLHGGPLDWELNLRRQAWSD